MPVPELLPPSLARLDLGEKADPVGLSGQADLDEERVGGRVRGQGERVQVGRDRERARKSVGGDVVECVDPGVRRPWSGGMKDSGKLFVAVW